MSIPSLQVYQSGVNQVSGDQLNTFAQTCTNVADLRNFIGVTGMQVYMQGFTDPEDGGQGFFYWNANGTAPDDGGITTIVPNGSGAGEWTRLSLDSGAGDGSVTTSGSPQAGDLTKFSAPTVITSAISGVDYLAPTGNGSQLTNITASQLSGTVSIAKGGTGSTNAGAAIDALTGATGTGVQLLNRTGTGTYTSTPQSVPRVLGTYGFYDYLGSAAVQSDAIAQLQGFLLSAQLKAYALNNNSLALDDQMQRNFIIAELPRGNYQVTCPLIIPEQVALRFQGSIIRVGQSGTATNFYTGDVTTKALANLVQPTVVLVPNAHILDNLDIYANSNGGDRGSGLAVGKNWYASSLTVVVAGSGYLVNDVITFPQVSKSPYFPIRVVVTSINGSGGITGVTFSGGSVGAYALPPILQQVQWTAANGFTGSIASGSIGQVFDPANTGYYITTGGTGTGAEFTVTWDVDFAGSGQSYSGGLGLQADTIIENVSVTGLGTTKDATYGPIFGTIWFGLNYDVGMIETSAGYYGSFLAGVADFHGGTIIAVNATNTAIKIAQGGSISFKAIVDSPVNIGLAIDGAAQVNIVNGSYGIQFNQPGITGPAYVAIGHDTNVSGATSKCSAINVNMTLQNAGSSGNTPAVYLDYMDSASKIDLVVANVLSTNSAVTYPNSYFAQFGSHLSSNFTLTGSIDNITGSIFSGTVPVAGISVWDGIAGGLAGPGGAYRIYAAGAPTNGTTGANKAAIGSLYTDLTAGNLYRNTGTQASPTWTEFS